MSRKTAQQLREERLRSLSDLLPPDESLYDLAELYKLFGDSTRIKILYALLQAPGGSLCVADIAQLLGLTQPAASHQLRILKGGKLIRSRREGRTVYYALADEHVTGILSLGMDHIAE